MPYYTPEQENKELRACGLITLVLGLTMLALLDVSCNGKSKSAARSVPMSTPAIDTARLRLEQRAKASADTAATKRQQASSTQIDYEQAQKRYDELPLSLP